MTENKAIKVIRAKACNDRCTEIHCDDSCMYGEDKCAFYMAIKALEEIQQYRAMEEKLNGISVAQVVSGFINAIEKGTAEEYMRGRILTNAESDMWDEYRAIGTIEECKMAMGKVFAKKRTILHGNYYCCECGKLAEKSGHCRFCGQSLY